jgi:hypothetical protein
MQHLIVDRHRMSLAIRQGWLRELGQGSSGTKHVEAA